MEPSCCGLRSPGHPNLLSQHLPTSIVASRSGLCFPALSWSRWLHSHGCSLPGVPGPLCAGHPPAKPRRDNLKPCCGRGAIYSQIQPSGLRDLIWHFLLLNNGMRTGKRDQEALGSLAGLGAEPGVPCPGGEADGVPHVQALLPTAAVFPRDGFPHDLSLSPSISQNSPAASHSCSALAKALSRARGLMWPCWGFTLCGA